MTALAPADPPADVAALLGDRSESAQPLTQWAIAAGWSADDPPPRELPYDDGIPLDTHRHRLAIDNAIRILRQNYPDRQDWYVGGNMFVYFSAEQVKSRNFL